MMDCGFAEFLYQGLSVSFKAQYLSEIEEDLCLAGCHAVAHWYAFGVAWLNSRVWG